MARAEGRPGWPALLWAGVGVLFGLGVVGILNIGIFALMGGLLLAIVGLVLRPSRSAAVIAVIPGLGILPVLVGLANLGGPGVRCTSSAGSSSCIELLSPWPFLVPGLLLIVGGGWLVWRVARRPPGGSGARGYAARQEPENPFLT